MIGKIDLIGAGQLEPLSFALVCGSKKPHPKVRCVPQRDRPDNRSIEFEK